MRRRPLGRGERRRRLPRILRGDAPGGRYLFGYWLNTVRRAGREGLEISTNPAEWVAMARLGLWFNLLVVVGLGSIVLAAAHHPAWLLAVAVALVGMIATYGNMGRIVQGRLARESGVGVQEVE